MQYVCFTGCMLILSSHIAVIKKNKYYKPKKAQTNISLKQQWVVCSCRWMNAWIRSCIQLLVRLWLMNSILLFINAVEGNVIIWAWKWPWFCCSADARANNKNSPILYIVHGKNGYCTKILWCTIFVNA